MSRIRPTKEALQHTDSINKLFVVVLGFLIRDNGVSVTNDGQKQIHEDDGVDNDGKDEKELSG